MDFRFTEEEEAFRKELRQFLRKEIPPEWDDLYQDTYTEAALDRQLRRKLGEKGRRTMAWPKEYGGQGASPMQQLIYKEELVYNGAKRSDDQGVEYIGPTIILHGTEEQKRYHLPRIASGEEWWCQGFSEPEAGSDLASLQTRATLDGDDYVINGRKIWTSHAHLADWMHLLARTDPDAPKHKGISYFLLEIKAPGITVRPLVSMTGRHQHNEVFFDDVRVPRRNRLGEENRGWYVAMSTLDFERSGVEYSAAARRVLERVVEYARETRHDGMALAVDPVVSAKLAERAVEIEVARLLCYRIAWMQGRGLVPNAEASMGKLFGAEVSRRTADTVTEVLGMPSQLLQDSRWAHLRRDVFDYYLDHMMLSIGLIVGSGTPEIQRNIIATRGLGLPRGG
ncbi:MAG: acyl-CoA dehydrogenase family protein [Dehalococcoidia bacterium]